MTNLEKYGYSNPLLNPKIKEKATKTINSKFGEAREQSR